MFVLSPKKPDYPFSSGGKNRLTTNTCSKFNTIEKQTFVLKVVSNTPSNYQKRLKPPSFLEFQQRFPSEESCAKFLFKQRWPNGWICPKCQSIKAYWIVSRKVYECSHCRSQVSLTARTILHKTRTPLQLWFWTIFLMTTDKRGISSVGLGKQLGISQKQAWFMLHKIRQAMSWREERYQLDGFVELNESFFGAPKEGGSRGLGSAKTRVLVALFKDECVASLVWTCRNLIKKADPDDIEKHAA